MPRTHCIFVDFENVQEIDVDLLKGKPVKLVVVSGIDQKLPVKLASKLPSCGEQVSWVLSPGKGKNALDFVLAYQVGRMLADEPKALVHIVSRDKDYEALLKYLNQDKNRAFRYDAFAEIPILTLVTPPAKPPMPKSPAKVRISPALEDQVKLTLPILAPAKTNRPQSRDGLLRTIAKHLNLKEGNSDAGAVFAEVKKRGIFTENDKGGIVYAK